MESDRGLFSQHDKPHKKESLLEKIEHKVEQKLGGNQHQQSKHSLRRS